MSGPDLSLSTLAVGAGRPARTPGGPLNAPITLASALVPGGDSEYGRHGNPAWEAFETALGALEGGKALAFASGQAAAAAVIDLVPLHGIVVAPEHAYSGTLVQLTDRARRGLLELRLVDVTDLDAMETAAEGAALLWMESPTNPMLDVADLKAVAGVASRADTALAVDNTFATPLRQRPLELGADFVVHSASKLISGHSDVILGAVVTQGGRAHEVIEARRSNLGAIPGALECWLATRGLRTLHVRLDRAEQNARTLAERLTGYSGVKRVRYPGFGTIISFEVAAGAEAAQKITEMGDVITYATSLGGVESTWERRRRHAAEPQAVPADLVRLSVGIEDVEDIWADVKRCLDVL
ncbi:cystathionine gamma-synthase [Aeromicrobium sp. Root495]|uniref:trans-sulfuration enzyme family protein n=1 Tax=Aeromicrobium sp. Root495 TaxID=1736550 RepID=UPI000700F2B3|nr:PLP-dependent transferase [Aeromicrobium sp. Root495]KQY58839.1 cystathionine gamma-synthase [Aeromicrobium sp. Root495]